MYNRSVADILKGLDQQRSSVLPLPILQPIPTRKDGWMYVEDWQWEKHFIPRFFFCDLDSVPRLPFIYPFLKGYARTSAGLHDWYYATKLVSKDEADAVFYRCMLLEGVAQWRARLIYLAVHYFGHRAYGRRRNVYQSLMAEEVRRVIYRPEVSV